MNFSPSWSAFETSIGFELTATVVDVNAACLGLCWLDLGISCWMVDWSADAVAVVSADAAILSRSRADSLTHSRALMSEKGFRLWLSAFVGVWVSVRGKVLIEILYAMWDALLRNRFDVVARIHTASVVASSSSLALAWRRHSIKCFFFRECNLIF